MEHFEFDTFHDDLFLINTVLRDYQSATFTFRRLNLTGHTLDDLHQFLSQLRFPRPVPQLALSIPGNVLDQVTCQLLFGVISSARPTELDLTINIYNEAVLFDVICGCLRRCAWITTINIFICDINTNNGTVNLPEMIVFGSIQNVCGFKVFTNRANITRMGMGNFARDLLQTSNIKPLELDFGDTPNQ